MAPVMSILSEYHNGWGMMEVPLDVSYAAEQIEIECLYYEAFDENEKDGRVYISSIFASRND